MIAKNTITATFTRRIANNTPNGSKYANDHGHRFDPKYTVSGAGVLVNLIAMATNLPQQVRPSQTNSLRFYCIFRIGDNSPSMFTIIWEFDVRPEFWNIYREEYSSNGIWAQLFRQANGYRGTALLIDESTPHRAVTIDRWEREEDFNEFKNIFAEEYQALDKRCEQYTLSERLIGKFKEAF
jgi:heme-degrading monooxygenase HmoA